MHNAERLARFQDGETRLVYARHREDPSRLFLLEDGAAGAQRAFTKERLECFVPECLDRGLTTVSRFPKGRRDGFRHLSGGSHAPESLFHLQAKRRIIDWAQGRYASVRAVDEAPLAGRERIADVLITSDDPPGRLAVEVQYSSLGDEAWKQRHEWYQAEGIHDCWLLGHAGRHFPRLRDEGYVLSPLHRALAVAGMQLLWINPITGEIATAVADASRRVCSFGCRHGKHREYLVTPNGEDHIVQLVVSDLQDCWLSRGVFTTPVMWEMREPTRAWAELRTSEHEERDKRLEAANERLAERLLHDRHLRLRLAPDRQFWRDVERRERKERKRLSRERRRKLQDEKATAQPQERVPPAGYADWWTENWQRVDAEWEVSPVRGLIAAGTTSDLRWALTDPIECDDAVLTKREHWRGLLYFEHVHLQPGHEFKVKDCLATLKAAGIQLHPTRGATAVARFIDLLTTVGLVVRPTRHGIVASDAAATAVTGELPIEE